MKHLLQRPLDRHCAVFMHALGCVSCCDCACKGHHDRNQKCSPFALPHPLDLAAASSSIDTAHSGDNVTPFFRRLSEHPRTHGGLISSSSAQCDSCCPVLQLLSDKCVGVQPDMYTQERPRSQQPTHIHVCRGHRLDQRSYSEPSSCPGRQKPQPMVH